MLLLLKGTVRNKEVFIDGESKRFADEEFVICKDPDALCTIPDLKRPIIMVRDPRAVLTSEFIEPGHYLVAGDVLSNGKHPGLIKNHTVMRRNYYEENIFRYEQLVHIPDQMQHRIGDYWKLEFDWEFSDWPDLPRLPEISQMWAKKMGGRRPIDSGHDWREHMQRVRQQFDAFPELFNIVTDLGYEEDDSWYQEVLDCTEPQKYKRPIKSVATVKPKGLKIGFKKV